MAESGRDFELSMGGTDGASGGSTRDGEWAMAGEGGHVRRAAGDGAAMFGHDGADSGHEWSGIVDAA
jgi:hypothetical protein